MKTRLFLCPLVLALAPWYACGAADTVVAAAPVAKVSVLTGFDYSTGDYGLNSNTDILAIPVTARCDVDRWTLKVTVPYLHVSGPGNVVTGLGAVLPSGQSARQTRSGLGDAVTTATYNVCNNAVSGLSIDVTGKVKFGTASRSKGLGTGENDFSGEVDVYQKMGDLTPFGSLGYKTLGSPPGIDLKDVFFESVGVDYKVAEGTNVGASFLLQGRIASSIDPAKELLAYVSHRLDNEWRIQGYVLTGFSNASPKFEIGGQVGYTF